MTRLVLLNHTNFSTRPWCPTIVSIIEEGPVLTIKTHDIIAGFDYYNFTSADQGCHIWRIDRATFWDDKPYLPNKAGIFGICGWDFSAPIIPGVGYTGAYLSYSLQAMFYYDTGQTTGPYETFMEAADPRNKKCHGLVFLRRQNAVETAEDVVLLRVAPDAHVQTNLTIETMADEDWKAVHDKSVPFTIEYTGPTTIGNAANLEFTVAANTNPLPAEWNTFYVKADKGYAPKTIPIANNVGIIPFDASSMASGETATIKVGLDFLARAQEFTITKA